MNIVMKCGDAFSRVILMFFYSLSEIIVIKFVFIEVAVYVDKAK